MAAEVIACHTVEDFNGLLQQAEASQKLVVIDFTASWCGPCRFIAPVFAEYAKKFADAIFLKVDVDELKTVAADYKVEAMPTFVFVKNGQKVDTVVGAKKEELQNSIQKHIAAA